MKIYAILGIILALIAAGYYIQDYGNVRCTLNVTKASAKEDERKDAAAAELGKGNIHYAVKTDREIRYVLNTPQACGNTNSPDRVAVAYDWMRPKNH